MNFLLLSDFIFSMLMRITPRTIIVALLIWLLVKIFRSKNVLLLHFIWTTILIGMLFFPIVFWLIPYLSLNPYVQISAFSGLPRFSGANAHFSLWFQLTAAVYLSGLAIMLIRLIAGLLSVRRMIRQSQIINNPNLENRLNRVLQTSVRRKPRLLCSESIKAPVTVGYFRPCIVLPANWSEWSEEKMHSVLAHEAAHIRRADYLVRILALLNECFYWFHPLAWYISRRLSFLSERICDDAAVKVSRSKFIYARHLLEIAVKGSQNQKQKSFGIAMAEGSRLKQRIEAVLDTDSQLLEHPSWTSLIFITLFVSVFWIAAALLCF